MEIRLVTAYLLMLLMAVAAALAFRHIAQKQRLQRRMMRGRHLHKGFRSSSGLASKTE